MYRSRQLAAALLPAALLSLLATTAAAQCGFDWQTREAPGPLGAVWASARMTNGDLIAGGQFSANGNIARFDGTSWAPIGAGVSGSVYCMTKLPNGDLLVGGSFATADGVLAPRIARFDGTTFHPFGSGLDGGAVASLLALPNGEVFAGGSGLYSNGVSMKGLARWNGSSWSPFFTGTVGGYVNSMTRLSNGDLVFSGLSFVQGSNLIGPLLRYDGTTVTAIPGLDAGSHVEQVLSLPLGQFALCGTLSIGGTQARVALGGASTILDLGAPNAGYTALAIDDQNRLLAGGNTGALVESIVARYDGAQWTVLPSGCPRGIRSLLAETGGAFIASGVNSPDNLFRNSTVRRFDGTDWHDFGPAAPLVHATATLPNGDIVVGGDFTSIDGVAANHVARWDGNSWHAMGSGLDGVVACMHVNRQGLVVAGGDFLRPGSPNVGRVAVWNGVAWAFPGNGLGVVPKDIAMNGLGQVMTITNGGFRFFDGTNWQIITGVGPVNYTIAVDDNDEFLFGGLYTNIPGSSITGMMRLTGGNFVAEPTGMVLVRSIIRLRDGRLVAAGTFGSGILSMLSGGSWQTIATTPYSATALTELPDGNLLVTAPTGTSSVQQVAKLANGGLVPIGTLALYASSLEVSLAAGRQGDVVIGGAASVLGIDGILAPGLLHGTPRCPAAATVTGAGCFGAAGPVTLGATDLPWLGGFLHEQLLGIGSSTIALHLAGLDAVLQPLPLGAPGCTLQVDPVLIDAFVTGPTTSDIAFYVPPVAALIGQQLRTQVVALETSASGAITRTTSSNALQLTVGAL